MSLKVDSIKCPDCGASLPVEEGRNKFFCSYCGAQVVVTNENEHIYRHINEAEIKYAETDRIVKLKKLDYAEKRKDNYLAILITIALSVVLFLLLVFKILGDSSNMVAPFCLLGIWGIWYSKLANKEKDTVDDGMVTVPTVNDYTKKTYITIEAKFKSAGFTNIQCIPLCDLKKGIFKKPDMVESITINGKQFTSGNQKFPPDATVLISYHSFP